MKSPSKPESWFRDLLLLVFLLGCFFSFKLGERALWSPDEGRYSEVAREMAVSGDYITPRLDGVKFFEKPPLFYWTQSAAIKLFGLNEWDLRLGPAMFALLGCLAVYFCGGKLFGRKTGWCAALVLATCGLHYAMSRMANLDMGLSTLLSCALMSFLLGTCESVGRRRRLAMWSFYLFAALAVLQKGLIGIVLPGLIIGSWIVVFGEWNILKTLYLPSGLALFLAVALPWHVLVSAINPEFFSFYFIREHFQRFLYKNGPFDHPLTYVPVLLIGLFPWSVFLYPSLRHSLFLRWRPRHGYREAVFLALWAGWVFAFFSLSSSKVITYILPMLPPLALLIGRYLAAAMVRSHMEGLRTGYGLLLVTMLVFVAVGLKGPQHYIERYSNWPDLEVPKEESTIPSTTLTFYSDLHSLSPYVNAQLAILILGILVTVYLANRRGFTAVFASLALTSALFLAVLNSSLPLFDHRRSVKDLALALKPELGADDEIASYHAYYQDLPFYLQRHVTQVGWVEPFELWEEDFNKQASDDRTFWQKWDSPRRIFVVTDRATYDHLRREKKRIIHLVAQNEFSVVVSNRSDKPV
jgi:hypothetical protein